LGVFLGELFEWRGHGRVRSAPARNRVQPAGPGGGVDLHQTRLLPGRRGHRHVGEVPNRGRGDQVVARRPGNALRHRRQQETHRRRDPRCVPGGRPGSGALLPLQNRRQRQEDRFGPAGSDAGSAPGGRRHSAFASADFGSQRAGHGSHRKDSASRQGEEDGNRGFAGGSPRSGLERSGRSDPTVFGDGGDKHRETVGQRETEGRQEEDGPDRSTHGVRSAVRLGEESDLREGQSASHEDVRRVVSGTAQGISSLQFDTDSRGLFLDIGSGAHRNRQR
jgi:hypothetical protein